MSTIEYNGVSLQLIQTNRYSCVPVYSADGMDYLYSSHFYDFNCIFNPDATSYPNRAGPSDTFNNLRHALEQPRGRLVIHHGGAEPLIVSPADGPEGQYQCDVMGGPFPRGVYLVKLGGDRTWTVNLKIETFLLECPSGNDATALLSNRYQQTASVDDAFMTTIATEGLAVFRQDVLQFSRENADSFRRRLLPPIPRGFQRAGIQVTVAPQRNQISYQVVDRERYFDLGQTDPALGGNGVLDVKATYRTAGVRAKDSGALASMTYETVDVHVQGHKTASMWRLTQFAINLARTKLPLGDRSRGFITQAAISQSMTDKTVAFQVSMQLNPAPNGKVGILNSEAMRIDLVFPDRGGINPAPPNDGGSRGYHQAELALAALKTACSAPEKGGAGPTSGGDKYPDYDSNQPPDVQVEIGGDDLPDTRYKFSYPQTSSAFTDYHIDTEYATDHGILPCPVAGPEPESNDGQSGPNGEDPNFPTGDTGDGGAGPVSGTPLPRAKPQALTVAAPMSLMIVQGTAERINHPPLMPKSDAKLENMKLLDRRITASAPELLGDGQTYVYRTSFWYRYLLMKALGDADPLALGASPMFEDVAASNVMKPEVYIDDILPKVGGPEGEGGGDPGSEEPGLAV